MQKIRKNIIIFLFTALVLSVVVAIVCAETLIFGGIARDEGANTISNGTTARTENEVSDGRTENSGPITASGGAMAISGDATARGKGSTANSGYAIARGKDSTANSGFAIANGGATANSDNAVANTGETISTSDVISGKSGCNYQTSKKE